MNTAPSAAPPQAVGSRVARGSPGSRAWRQLGRRVAALIAVLAASALRSWQLGVDTNWDLLNYHLYKGRALLDGSLFTDVAAAELGTFLNPLLDLPVGVLNLVMDARSALLIGMALVQAACLLAAWRLAAEIARIERGGQLQTIALTALFVTGSCALSVGFTTFGDWPVAALLCESLRALLQRCAPTGDKPLRWGDARIGIWAGVAIGMKLTAVPLVVGLGVAWLVLIGVRRSFLAALGTVGGFIVAAGPWMLYMQRRYSSPLFPFANGIFGAGGAPTKNFDDPDFGARSVAEIVQFPVAMLRGTSTYTGTFQDWRYLVVVAAVAAWTGVSGRRLFADRKVIALCGALAAGFGGWIVMFGVYRYFLFGEILAAAIIVVVVFRVIGDKRRAMAACLVLGALGLASIEAPDWGRDAEVSSPALREAIAALPAMPSVVVLSAPPPLAYLLGEFPDGAAAFSLARFPLGDVLYGVRSGPRSMRWSRSVVRWAHSMRSPSWGRRRC